MSNPRPNIIYFNIRGRAEVIRLIFEELGVAYDEQRISSPEEWTAMKPLTPFGALPIYEEGELRFAQTQAIYRHIARTRGLYGRDEREHVECDVTAEAINEGIEELWRLYWEPDYKDKLDAFADGRLTEVLRNLERWFTRHSAAPDYWVGDALTYADFVAYRFLDEVDALFPKTLAARPALQRFRAAFNARPRIAAYIASGRRPAVFGIIVDGLKFDPRVKGRPRSPRA
jgi:glutathione S-transferase